MRNRPPTDRPEWLGNTNMSSLASRGRPDCLRRRVIRLHISDFVSASNRRNTAGSVTCVDEHSEQVAVSTKRAYRDHCIGDSRSCGLFVPLLILLL